MSLSAAIVKPKKHRWPLSQMCAAPVRPNGVTAGSWVHGLMALGKAIMLCYGCEGKLSKADLRKYHYRRIEDNVGYDHVFGDCDGCKSKMVKCRFYQQFHTAR